MPTGKQMRAARMLVDWTADDLAARTGFSRECILQAERGDKRPRNDTVEKIVRVFCDAGVEFNGERGVSLVSDNFRVLEGSDCYLRLLDEVLHTLKEIKGAEVLSICTDDALSPPEVVQAIQAIHDAGIKCRYLSHEKATRFDFPLEEYRLIPSEFFRNSVVVVYANKIATVRTAGDGLIIVTDKNHADMLRHLFELIWSVSLEPSVKKRRKS